MKVLDVCINYGCNNKRASSGAKSKGDKLRPYCGRCHLAVRGKTTYKEGVSPVKKTFCENKDGRLGFICATKGATLFSCMLDICLLYTSPSPRDVEESRMPSSA